MMHRGKDTKKIACSEKITNCGHMGLNPTEDCQRNHVERASGGSWGIYLPYLLSNAVNLTIQSND